ncbi:MAG: recombination regulator RecX [Burkholderiales bacterium]|nr:recombination regulator RecX [Burkholderiales bacterium]
MIKPQMSLKARALRFLSMREHSRAELLRKLSPYVQDGENLELILDWLESGQYLSDQRFSESLAHRRQGRFGNQKIFAELHSHQLKNVDINELKLELQQNEGQRAIEVLHRKFSHGALDASEKAKQMRFLAQRGFSSSAIHLAMRAEREEI